MFRNLCSSFSRSTIFPNKPISISRSFPKSIRLAPTLSYSSLKMTDPQTIDSPKTPNLPPIPSPTKPESPVHSNFIWDPEFSREKKDRRDYDELAALATSLGLYSHAYAKVVVFSKIPLPNYRFDLDDKRPQREVNLHMDLVKRVEAYLREYLSKRSTRMDIVPASSFSRCSSTSSIATDEGLLEQPEPMAASKTMLEILWRKSLQLRDRQEYCKESL